MLITDIFTPAKSRRNRKQDPTPKRDFTIRRATPFDLDGCHRVETECFPQAEAASRESIAKRIDTFAQGFLVAERREGGIAGMINSGATSKRDISDEAFKDLVGHEPDGGNMVVFSLSVRPRFQGRGLARQLMERFIEECRVMGRERILLLCKDFHIGFYEKLGFSDLGPSACAHGGAAWQEMGLALA